VSSVRCLYLSPLKALGNDVRKTLRSTIAGIQPFLDPGERLPHVMLRTGDTPYSTRQRMLLDPPDVLLTTPESLAVLLTHPNAADLFGDLRAVVLDELHALAPSKRGADLAVSLERLERIAGQPIQRIGLSATCRPVPEAMRFLTGDRPCTLVQVDDATQLELTIRPLNGSPRFLTQLLELLGPELERNRSTLIFCNTRSLAERVSWALRRRFPAWEPHIAVHHSALAATRRRRVELEFKGGQLRAVVCSTSLELGIDIGAVDGVVLVHPPGGVSRLLQRVGRAGHGPGLLRRGLILTGSTPELLEATVTAASGRSGQFEPLSIARAPLDVLCQQLLGMAASGAWLPDDAFALVRRAAPFANLSRREFDDCLDYLFGAGQWLPARLQWLDDRFTIRSEREARILRRNLGTIVTEEPAAVRSETPGDETTRLVGEVDQQFAERLQPGDRFLLDGRCLEYRRQERGPSDTALTLIVHEVPGRPQVPRWTGEGLPLSSELARRLFELRSQVADMLREGTATLRNVLERDYQVHGEALDELVSFFERQETFSEIPAPNSCLIEAVRAQEGADYYVHNPLNRAANDALSRVVAQRLLRMRQRRVITIGADLGFALVLRGTDDLTPDDFRKLLAADGFVAELHTILADSPALRERFQRIAYTGLMLLRNTLGPKRRVGGEHWGERRLFDQVREKRPDFVLLRQAERELTEQVCDGAEALRWLGPLPNWALKLRWLPRPSPFVEGWTQATLELVEPAESPEDVLRRLHASLHHVTPVESRLPS